MAGRIVLQQTGDSFVKTINQIAHGFSAGDWVRVQGTGVYVLAKADNEVNAEVIGVVEEVIDVDNFKLRTAGYLENSSIVPNEPSGTVFGLDPDTAGLASKDPDLQAGDISKPLFVVTIPNLEYFILTYRGIEIGEPILQFGRQLFTADASIVSSRTVTVTNDIVSNREDITLNGQIVYEGGSEAYTISGKDVVFNSDVDLIVGDKIRVDYFY